MRIRTLTAGMALTVAASLLGAIGASATTTPVKKVPNSCAFISVGHINKLFHTRVVHRPTPVKLGKGKYAGTGCKYALKSGRLLEIGLQRAGSPSQFATLSHGHHTRRVARFGVDGRLILAANFSSLFFQTGGYWVTVYYGQKAPGELIELGAMLYPPVSLR